MYWCCIAYRSAKVKTFQPPRNRGIEKLTAADLVKKFPVFCGSRRFHFRCSLPFPVLRDLDPVRFHFISFQVVMFYHYSYDVIFISWMCILYGLNSIDLWHPWFAYKDRCFSSRPKVGRLKVASDLFMCTLCIIFVSFCVLSWSVTLNL
jgi:hypothetical protein